MSDCYAYNLGIRFQQVTAEFPDRTAIWFRAEDKVSYGALNRLANQMARWLQEQGLEPGNVINITGIKSIHTFAIMLASLKLGVAYVVLDPTSPVERLLKIVVTCRPKLLFAEGDLLDSLEQSIGELKIVPVERDPVHLTQVLRNYETTDLPQTRQVTGHNPAYVMYTSGSTGFPKGAVITHDNVLNLIQWSRETYSLTAEDILTNVNPLYFDNSVFDFYSALFTGACLVPFSKAETQNPKLLVEKVHDAQCTSWFSVPSLLIFLQTMKALDGKNLRSIRRFIFGGEGYPKAKLKKLYEAYAPASAFFNVYGPTECTCICSSYQLSAPDFEDVQGLPPIGTIAPNFGFLVLDSDDKVVPSGAVGELCLLGPNVGRGYYNDPERTATAFVQHPYNRSFQEIMYKTGDLVRLNPADGKLYIYGRKDNQIKHMGYRIELEEVEAALHCLDYVSEAAALHTNVAGLSRLVAIVATVEEFDAARLRHDLQQIIPDYMVPTLYYREAMLPKNANGKVDRRALMEKYL